MKTIYFLMRSDEFLITNNFGLPEVWTNKVLCEAMQAQLNATSLKHNLPYTFRIIESNSIG